jgi:hypothetical protein
LPLTRELYPGDAERDAAVLLARATHDGKAQTARLREREKKLGLGKRLTEKKRERGGSRRGRGSGSGRGSGRAGRGSGRAGRGSFVYEHANASSGDPAANLGGDSDDVSRSEAEFFSAEDALTDEEASQ